MALRKFDARVALSTMRSMSSSLMFFSKTGNAMPVFRILGPLSRLVRFGLLFIIGISGQHDVQQPPEEVFPRVAFDPGQFPAVLDQDEGGREDHAAFENHVIGRAIGYVHDPQRGKGPFGRFGIDRAELGLPFDAVVTALAFDHDQLGRAGGQITSHAKAARKMNRNADMGYPYEKI